MAAVMDSSKGDGRCQSGPKVVSSDNSSDKLLSHNSHHETGNEI